ncbi:MAG: RDD family protein [Bacteroidota bacterium]
MSEGPTLDEDFIGGEPSLRTVRFAGFGPRLAATLIDFLALIPISGLIAYNAVEIKSLPLLFVLFGLANLYKPFMEWKEGATLGKMAMKIKVVNKDLGPISGEQAFHRYALWIGTMFISVAMEVQLFNAPNFGDMTDYMETREWLQNSSLSTINFVYFTFFLIAVGSLVIDERKQGLHDKLARTYCIHR